MQAKFSCSRKDKPAAQILAQSFSWGEVIDAVADVYNGVRMETWNEIRRLMLNSSSSGLC
jgi:hypothetical protein